MAGHGRAVAVTGIGIVGPTGLGKERVEIFCDGEAYLVDDYKRVIRSGDGSVLWQSGEPVTVRVSARCIR